MVSTVTWKCNQVTNTRKMKGAARVGNSATGRNGKTNKGMGRQGRQTKTKGIWCGKTEGRGKGLEQNNKQSKKSYDVSRGVTKIRDTCISAVLASPKIGCDYRGRGAIGEKTEGAVSNLRQLSSEGVTAALTASPSWCSLEQLLSKH